MESWPNPAGTIWVWVQWPEAQILWETNTFCDLSHLFKAFPIVLKQLLPRWTNWILHLYRSSSCVCLGWSPKPIWRFKWKEREGESSYRFPQAILSGSNHCQDYEGSTRCAMYMPYSVTLFHSWDMEITSEAASEVLKEILRFLQSHQKHYGVIIMIIKKSRHKALLPIHWTRAH